MSSRRSTCLPSLIFACAIAGVLVAPGLAQGAEAQVAVAANFAEPMKALAALLQKTTGHHLKITQGATGKLYAQIRQGAPFDVLLSADSRAPTLLAEQGLAIADSQFTYAQGKLVLWSATVDRVDAHGLVLTAADVNRIAYANPKLAPYGLAAEQVIKQLGLSASLAPRLVQGESIGQAFSFTYSGAADVGFVAMSQVLKDGKLRSGSVWVIPQRLYDPIRQDAILLQRGAHNEAALALMKLLRSPSGQALIRAAGYDT
jgi:molybdate transport system substrate-binding protein